jgi:hypothetical protein
MHLLADNNFNSLKFVNVDCRLAVEMLTQEEYLPIISPGRKQLCFLKKKEIHAWNKINLIVKDWLVTQSLGLLRRNRGARPGVQFVCCNAMLDGVL